MAYVDGFVASVPDDKKAAFIAHAKSAAAVFLDHGALSVRDCWGDDVPDGELTSFPMAVKCAEGETVVLSWVIWPDKAARDAGWAAAMADPRFDPADNPMPFDGKRCIIGGFETVFEA